MFNINVTFDADPIAYFRDLADFLNHAEDALFEAGVQAYAVTTAPALDLLSTEGAPVNYPLDWASERQKVAVKAKLRRQGNLPYRRTGAYQQGWSIALLRATGYTRFVLSNPVPYAVYVGGGIDPAAPGAHQQPMFRKRWQQTAPVVQQWANDTIAAVEANFRVLMAKQARIRHTTVRYS